MNTSPGIPTENGEYNPQWDSGSSSLTDWLNAVVEQVPTAPHVQRANVITNSDVGIVPDNLYNVGFHMAVFDKDQVKIEGRFEAPNVPVTHTPWSQAIAASTHFQQQVIQPIAFNLRAPGINEGF